MKKISIKLLNQDVIFTLETKDCEGGDLETFLHNYECEKFDLRLSINVECIEKFGVEKCRDCIEYCLQNREKLIDDYSQADMCGKSKFNYFNEDMVGYEPFTEPINLQEFKNNLKIRTIDITEHEENNFTGNPDKNHIIHIGINNNYMFGSGWSEIQISKDFDNTCYL